MRSYCIKKTRNSSCNNSVDIAEYNYPRIEINLILIEENIKKIVRLCKTHGIGVTAVTKLVSGSPEIAEILAISGIEMLSDARVENIRKYQHCEIPKMMLRLPMRSQVDQIVEFCDVSLVSDLEMMNLLSEAAIKKHTIHNVVVMIDMGDLREGLFYEDEIHKTFNQVCDLLGVRVIGIGTNLSCYGGVMPSQELLEN